MESLPKINPVESGRGERIKATYTGGIPYDQTELFAAKPVVRGVAELRWSISQLIERMQTTRLPAGEAQRDNFMLALRHLEDAHHRLTLALE